MSAIERIQVGRRSYRRFVLHPNPVTDGTLRCISCGQIDEDGLHEEAFCPAMGGSLPLSDKAKSFKAANAKSPVVYASAHKNGGGYYRLKDGTSFRLSFYDCRSLPFPWWDL